MHSVTSVISGQNKANDDVMPNTGMHCRILTVASVALSATGMFRTVLLALRPVVVSRLGLRRK